mmetsp:Transcript_92604/g.271097  ORF Transcript_92604/g.271097 Transcript_92604/m.271097 type:complete len:405 (+) Transcript_92604:82-1296(+)
MTLTATQSVRMSMKTPPSNTRRSWKNEPVPSGCFCGLLPLLRRAAGGGHHGKVLDAKLDALAAKIDTIARRVTLEDIQKLDEQAAQQVLEEAERDGIEVARYSQIPQFDASILDTYIPRCTRLTQLHFGNIVSNPHAPMAFKEKMGYNMTYNLVPPGHGNALHMHRSIEIFVALDGRWEIAWGMEGENTVVLEPWDFVAVPARVCHSYKNIEGQTAQNIMTILPGRSWITWAPNVVSDARKNGAECDDNGVLLKYAHLMANTKGLAASSDVVPWKSMGPDEMAPYLHRFSENRAFECQMTEEATEGEAPFIEMFWKSVKPDSSISLPRKEGVDMLLVVLDGSVLVKTGSGRPVAAAGKLDAVRVPRQALRASEVVISNPCPSACTLLVTVTQMRSHNELYFHLC